MADENHLMLFIPYSIEEPPKLVRDRKDYLAAGLDTPENRIFSEGYAISPELALLCQCNYNGKPNPHLFKFGVNYPGACLIIREVYDDDGACAYADVPTDLYDQLDTIMNADRIARENYQASLVAAGLVITI
tara:strand:- start:1919 stop:2314 length:396 start_codon:yes stop_codon:yes gene_type:complete